MSDALRKTLNDAGLDPRLHGGIDGAVSLLAGQRRELEASNADYRTEIAFLRWELDEAKKGRVHAFDVIADRRPWENPTSSVHADVIEAVARFHEQRFDSPIPAEVLAPTPAA